MRTTPSEAGQKLCPLTMSDEVREVCQGSQCMAWRWHRIPDNLRVMAASRGATRELVRPANVPSTWIWRPYSDFDDVAAHWLEPDEDALARATGYCGLAGETHA